MRTFAKGSKQLLENMMNSQSWSRKRHKGGFATSEAGRSSGLAKTIIQSTIEGKRRDSEKKRWKDNIKEWTGKDFASQTRAAENRIRWKGIVAVICDAPQPSKVMGIKSKKIGKVKSKLDNSS